MYAISLTSIPPRFGQLGPVLAQLLAQNPAPNEVILCLPRRFRRFPEAVEVPDVPPGVRILSQEKDLGPATKVLPAARAVTGKIDRLIYCDDDWLMPPDWAATLLEAQHDGHAVAGSGYSVERHGRTQASAPPLTDIAQGFAGVLINPSWLADPDLDPPAAAWAVDDIWLSGQLVRRGIPIRLAPAARAGLIPAFEDVHGLQDARVDGLTRAAANQSCLDYLTDTFGIWPPKG